MFARNPGRALALRRDIFPLSNTGASNLLGILTLSWAPILRRNSWYSLQAPTKTCCPLSTSTPVSLSSNEYALPPRKGRRSRSSVFHPASDNLTAAASPARPPPTTTALRRFTTGPVCGFESSVSPPGPPGRFAQADPLAENIVVRRFDASQQSTVHRRHGPGTRPRPPVQQGEEPGAAFKVLAGPFYLKLHQVSKVVVDRACHEVGLGISVFLQLFLR